MSQFSPRNSDQTRPRDLRRRMISDTEKFICRHLSDRFRRVNDRRCDPRVKSDSRRRQIMQTNSMPQSFPGVVIVVPTDGSGHLSDEMLGPLVSQLSRLASTPWRGDVLLDFSQVTSISRQSMQVFKWFRHKLTKQQRNSSMLANRSVESLDFVNILQLFQLNTDTDTKSF